jgi:plasmid replication initiation protein
MSKTVVKHNAFIEAKFKTPALTKAHGRILAYLVSMVHSKADKDFKYVEIIPADYKRLIGNTSYNIEQIKWDLKELAGITCEIDTPEKTAYCHLVDYAEVEKDSGMVRMRLGEEMRPYLLQLHSNYTMYYLEDFLRLRSKHSQRLYEIFQKEKNQKDSMVIEFALEEFKEMLGLVEYKNKGAEMITKYPRWVNFEARVLVPAREELCELGILFEYQPLLKSRKTVGVRLYFNPTAKSLDEQTFEEYQSLKSFPLKPIDKIDISRCRSKAEISKAIKQSIETGNHKPLEKLVPKSRKERAALFEKKLQTELGKTEKDWQKQQELF